MLHKGGQDDLAEREADIALLQHPIADPNQSTAQLVLDTIHSYDLMSDCEKIREIVRSDGYTVECNLDGSAVTQELTQNLQIHASEIKHWPNHCTTLVRTPRNPTMAVS